MVEVRGGRDGRRKWDDSRDFAGYSEPAESREHGQVKLMGILSVQGEEFDRIQNEQGREAFKPKLYDI